MKVFFGHNIGKRLHLPQYWCFGMIESDSNRIIILNVPNRSADSLVPLILAYVDIESTIVSDCWKSYCCLGSMGYKHLTVNHDKNFINPLNGCHTQRIESNWNSCKQWLREKDIHDRSKYQTYIIEWCFRHNLKFDFEKIFLEITK